MRSARDSFSPRRGPSRLARLLQQGTDDEVGGVGAHSERKVWVRAVQGDGRKAVVTELRKGMALTVFLGPESAGGAVVGEEKSGESRASS